MKKVILFATLLGSVSFSSMASNSPSVNQAKKINHSNTVNFKKPSEIQCATGTICGRLSAICYDAAVEGEWLDALQASIDYNCH